MLGKKDPVDRILHAIPDTSTWLQTGEDLMRVLLKGASLGVNAAIMNLPPESEAVRAQVRATIICSDVPILLLRFGRPRRKLVTPRRSPVDVMLHPEFRH